MTKVKISILKTTLGKELAAEYGIDGLRPVIMKLEATDEESKIDTNQSKIGHWHDSQYSQGVVDGDEEDARLGRMARSGVSRPVRRR